MTASVLLIDDEEALVRSISFALKGEGYRAFGAHSGAEGLKMLGQNQPSVVLLDLRLPDMSGMEVLESIRADHPDLPVIMISAHGDTRAAVKAVKLGAADYLTKPFELDELFHVIAAALDRKRMDDEIAFHRHDALGKDGWIGTSPAMLRLAETLGQIARSTSSRVLLLGESGTGKTMAARAIHRQSPRAEGPFIEVNCASLPEQLIEAELFGAEKGAYTGAHQKRVGLVSLAHHGTLFLDEIGELPLAVQAKFLHFLEGGQFRPIGSNNAQSADVRIVAATNRNLAEDVRQGLFREDLFYRLNVIQVALPPLRERAEDVPLLARLFAERYAQEENAPPIRLSEATERCLGQYSWPGNVRELRNLIERLTILRGGALITPDDLPADMLSAPSASGRAPIGHSLADTERALLEDALAEAGGHKSRAAEILGISRHALKRRLQRLGMEG
ncbi:sigma-54 dependent transcriptional regulator [Magnetospirillum sp. 64-120]|uniref:sigma-54-dependent transcriptional regulator n=1 Tax=Magnetospirillum sp. 64-120 TaxID=1895778 RepID=UPI00092AA173|nr:sigma-54 dependent transcriptional regulator [Magnetospirillum sp. 64-120]OJX77751.1 MAG: sigma-54-dependent Fis family transcriptional regulator [Magnetospirillum sp. 64-120]